MLEVLGGWLCQAMVAPGASAGSLYVEDPTGLAQAPLHVSGPMVRCRSLFGPAARVRCGSTVGRAVAWR